MDELIKELDAVVKHCGKVSPTTCKNGKCRFSHKQYGCVFEAMGMCSPYDWNLDEAAPYCEGGETDGEQ